MQLFYQPEISTGYLSPDESRHAIKVLRLKSGDRLDITDGKGNLYSAVITIADAKKCGFKMLKTTPVPKRNFSIHLAIAPTKNLDRMEWMVEKCTEIGIEKISFMLCKTSERKVISTERMEKIIVSALKQSGQAWLPDIEEIVPFKQLLIQTEANQKFIAHVDPLNNLALKDAAIPKEDYLVLIGPEGDFTNEELSDASKSGFRKVNLGPNRLRTETAGLVACQILNLVNH